MSVGVGVLHRIAKNIDPPPGMSFASLSTCHLESELFSPRTPQGGGTRKQLARFQDTRFQNTPPPSRGANRTRVVDETGVPRSLEGAGNAGCSAAPAASRAKNKKHTSKSPQVRRRTPAFPARMVLTVSFV